MSPDLARAIEVWIRGLVRSEIQAASGLADQFTARGPLPPGVSARTFRETCRSGVVADAHRDGKTWICSRAAWFAARARRPTARTPQALDASPTDTERADAMIREAGFTLTRR